MDHLVDFDTPFEQHEERRHFAFVDQPVAGAQADVGAARGQRLELGCGQRFEQRTTSQQIDSDHLEAVRSRTRRA